MQTITREMNFSECTFIFPPESPATHVRMRIFTPGEELPRPLGCHLFRHRLVPRERLAHIVSLQGVKMLRPSRIHISIESSGEEITRVRVGGRSVLVGEGRLSF